MPRYCHLSWYWLQVEGRVLQSASSHMCPGSNAEACGAGWQLQCQGLDPLGCRALLARDPDVTECIVYMFWAMTIYNLFFPVLFLWGAGIAQWLEHRTRDWKVAGLNPCWNGGRIFFSRVDFLCWLLFRYPFHPRVTAVARKRPRSFCQKCRWQVTAKHAYTLRMWILLNRASALVTTCP